MRQDTITTRHRTKPGRKVATTRQFQELNIPYYFSPLARRRQENIGIGDYVRVSGLDRKYELMEIFWKYGSVRVRQVGHVESITMPWTCITPWKNDVISSKTVMRAIGNWLFLGDEVYRLSDPDTVLTVKRINWDRGTSDLEDGQGHVYHNVSWDQIEFLHPENYHLPGDD